MARFSPDQLRDKALDALEEAASRARKAPGERTKAIRFALAYLWTCSGSSRDMFDWFWQSLATEHDIGRTQNLHASLNGIYLGLGIVRDP
jgi:hypothetical protein